MTTYDLKPANDTAALSPGVWMPTFQVSVWPARRAIYHHASRCLERARVLSETRKNFGGEKRHPIEAEIAELQAGAKNGRNLYRCEVCNVWAMWGPGWAAWGTMDEASAYVCCDVCRAAFKPRRRTRRTGT